MSDDAGGLVGPGEEPEHQALVRFDRASGALVMQRVRTLKVWPLYAHYIEGRVKQFECRADDREPPFAVGDVLRLREWSAEPVTLGFDCCAGVFDFPAGYSGREWFREVTYIARGGVVPPGFCIMSIIPIDHLP